MSRSPDRGTDPFVAIEPVAAQWERHAVAGLAERALAIRLWWLVGGWGVALAALLLVGWVVVR